jgi:hypothetical protein
MTGPVGARGERPGEPASALGLEAVVIELALQPAKTTMRKKKMSQARAFCTDAQFLWSICP